MKLAAATTITLLTLVGVVAPVYAQALPAIQQLQTRRTCQGCDLSNADLKGLDLSKVDLRDANLSNADLSGANLSNADLSGANLYLAKFQNATLQGANLSRANAKAAKFEGADLSASNLSSADLNYAVLPGANLSTADLSSAKLSDADLSRANLSRAKLVGANLNHANLSSADLREADLSSATLLATNLTQANLSAVKLGNADLTGATLVSANLSSADLTGTKLESANLKDADFTNANLVEAVLAKQPSVAQASPNSQPGSTPVATQGNPTELKAADSPLYFSQLPTAKTLRAGEVLLEYRQRFYRSRTGVAQGSGTPFFAGPGIRFGITNNLELALGAQIFDSGYVDRARGRIDDPNSDIALEAKYKIWQNASKTQTLSGVLSLSGFSRGATFNRGGGVTNVDGNGIIPALQFPFTIDVGDRAQFTVSPTLALFQEDSAVQLPTIPGKGGSFGPTFGVVGAASFRPFSRVVLWGNAFVPFTGNNSINFKTERPAKTVVFNAGLRYLVNPRLGVDVFATNGFGNLGPLALTGDREDIGVGVGVVIMPNIIAANRKYPNTFKGDFKLKDTPLTDDGLGFFDGGTVPSGKILTQFQGGNSGIMAAVRYGAVRDFEVGTYVDYVFGKVDESEQGVSAKVRLLNQADGAPFTASAAITIGRGNNLLENFRNNDATVFSRSGEDKSFPFIGSGDIRGSDRSLLPTLFIGTLSFPLQYQFKPGTAIWLTPTLGFVQRDGFALGGINAGGSLRVFKDVSILGEVGANFVGDGNAFINNRLANRIPWNFAVRWTPSNLLGLDYKDASARPSLELFVTNRVGASAWHQLRVREQNDPAVGVGVNFPF